VSPSLPRRTPALFLDRDGVVNEDLDFVHRVEDFRFIDGVFDLVRTARRVLGGPVVVVTNQSGIGRGLYTEAQFRLLTDWMLARFEAEGAPVDRVYHCPHHPEHGIGDYRRDHPWRKPNPGMLLQAADDLGIDLPASAMVGDRMSDIRAAAAAGVRTRILVSRRPPAEADGVCLAASSVREAADRLAAAVGGRSRP
jgi:D-glycero-D-manno-heptose 1,7-bisphosphate phosphatase